MRRLKSTFNCILLVSIFALSASAQKSFIKAGDNAFKSKEYYNAIDIYKKALAQNPKKEEKARLIFQIAECYRMVGDVKHQESEYAQAIKANYDDASAVLHLADAQMMQGKYDDAMANYQSYMAKVPSDPRGQNGVNSCKKAQDLKNNPTRYVVTNMQQLNTKFADFAPTYSDRRMDELIFTSTRQGTMGDKVDDGIGQNYSDLFITKLDKNGKFSAPLPLPAPINTPNNEGSAVFDKAFRTMYFTRCAVVKNKGEKCKIFSTERRGNNWTDPVMLNFQIDTVTYGHPAVAGDNTEIIFSSDLPGGQGGHDLWISHFERKTKTWGQPVNLGSGINTAGDEMYPYIHTVSGDLYYSSNGLQGMGGLDIYHAKKLGADKWDVPVNMGSPINSEGDDFAIVYEGAKDRGYFSSNRAGGRGGDDIYSFYLPPILFVIEGTVYDQTTHLGIPGATVRMVGSDGTDVTQKTDTGGHYMYGVTGNGNRYVNVNSSYILSASATELHYLASDEKANETTVGKTESETFIHDFQLLKPVERGGIRFPEVVYDLDKATLKDNSKDSLNYLVKLLNNNPTLAIQLDAHTDQQGSAQHNLPLSQARAKSCVVYLISQGIDSARLTSKGWGFTRLKIQTAQIMKEKSKVKRDSLYQINRRTEFEITSWSYVPKGHIMTKEDSLKMKSGMQLKVEGQVIQADTAEAAPVPEEERNQAVPPTKQPAAPQKQTPAPSAPKSTPAAPKTTTPSAAPKNNATKPKNN